MMHFYQTATALLLAIPMAASASLLASWRADPYQSTLGQMSTTQKQVLVDNDYETCTKNQLRPRFRLQYPSTSASPAKIKSSSTSCQETMVRFYGLPPNKAKVARVEQDLQDLDVESDQSSSALQHPKLSRRTTYGSGRGTPVEKQDRWRRGSSPSSEPPFKVLPLRNINPYLRRIEEEYIPYHDHSDYARYCRKNRRRCNQKPPPKNRPADRYEAY